MPSNPVDFRFRGIDGRGSQQLVRDPRSTGGIAVVRIEDSSGGSEGYTFDLEWRGGSGLGTSGSIWDGGAGSDAVVNSCQTAVRERAYQQYGSGNLQFRNMDSTARAGQGRRETISGTFDLQRGNTWQPFGFSCAVNTANGRVRSVNINPLDSGNSGDSAFGTGALSGSQSDCERAVRQQIRGDGYRDIEISSMQAGGRRNQQLAGTARARRGNDSRDFNFSCTVNPNNGQVRAVQVNPR